ncbi:unnamed protein product [Toxocara canis]|uniref:Alpha-mannosidase n=1 Tax=Toxocara canis TaxID=6265 RepID=A0A183TW99_TOXCA|nr:unnamed protein product [Toxocara canis]
MVWHVYSILERLSHRKYILAASPSAPPPPPAAAAVLNCNEWSKTKDTLNVHLICHTHDDLGWIKTVEEYYYGAHKDLVPVGVQYIIDSVATELQKDLSRRFSWAETGFLWRWINTHSDFQRHNLAKLVQKGQIEIVGGGWVQNDEATAHYIDIIDQMTFGLRKLNETFGKCGAPSIAWQIDPFGHSREMANLFAMMGFEGLFFARLHYLEKANRLKNNKTNILTGAFYQDNYGPPEGFCFDRFCSDDPIMDDEEEKDTYNVEQKVEAFLKHVKKQASHLRTNHVMLLMGSDFQYSNANEWFINLDKLIQYVNAKETETKVRVFYSTPSCYVEALSEAQPRLPQKNDDFFPYASSNHSFWTGYFTSRPTFKGFIRKSSSFLQLLKQLDAFACLGPMDEGDLDVLRRATALMQHHDAVTGTAKENVTRDYAKRLAAGWNEGVQVINDALSKLVLKDDKSKQLPAQAICPLINETICEVIRSSGEFTATVFNSNSHPLSTLVKTFFGTNQLEGTKRAPYELLIPVDIPALGFATYFVSNKTSIRSSRLTPSKYDKSKRNTAMSAQQPIVGATVNISNGIIEVDFDEDGYVSTIKNIHTGQTTKMRQEFLYYEGAGFNEGDNQSSGAYIFRPNGTDPKRLSSNITLQVVQGPLISEVRQTVNKWITQIIRLIKGKNYIEFEWTIGPIPKEDKNPITKEVITRYITEIASNGEFFTDANGRQIMPRKRNFSPSFEYVNTEPVASNYYPVNSRIFIKDANTQLTVLNDRSQGGSSLHDGQIELMLHRRAFYDDHWGVEEALDEPGDSGKGLVARGIHWIIIDSPTASPKMHRSLAFELFHSPQLSFAPLQLSVEQYRATFNTLYSGMTRSLPDHVKILTLEQWTGKSLLLRLEHIYQNNEDNSLSQPVTVDVEGLFTSFNVISLEELNLAANKRKRAASHWSNSWNRSSRFSSRYADGFSIELKPMEIRTFKVEVDMEKC